VGVDLRRRHVPVPHQLLHGSDVVYIRLAMTQSRPRICCSTEATS
jgi:hypothetical protein